MFVAILGTAFVNLGEWQLRRLHQREASNAQIIAAEKAPVVPFTHFFGRVIHDADQWHRVTITGTFDPAHQFLIRYRDNGGDRGYEVVTPLHADNGMTVLVDRGFVAVQSEQQIPSAAPAPPSGAVAIEGRVRRDEHGRSSAIVPVNGQVRLVNAVEIGKTLPYHIEDGYIDVLTMTPPQSGPFVAVETPEISNGPHLSYAIQWFLFTAIGVMGVVFFIRSDLKERRAAREHKQRQADDDEQDDDQHNDAARQDDDKQQVEG